MTGYFNFLLKLRSENKVYFFSWGFSCLGFILDIISTYFGVRTIGLHEKNEILREMFHIENPLNHVFFALIVLGGSFIITEIIRQYAIQKWNNHGFLINILCSALPFSLGLGLILLAIRNFILIVYA